MTSDVFLHFPMATRRAHEVQGPGGYFFAFALAGHLQGQVLWIRENWQGAQLLPDGFAPMLDPRNLLVAYVKDQPELLACAEEALRSGAVSLVVMELTNPIGLTEGRRLQLAARDGKCRALAIIPDGAGSNAAETRWQCAPILDTAEGVRDSTLQRWELIKNKSGTLGVWHVRWDQKTRRLCMVSPVGKRPGS